MSLTVPQKALLDLLNSGEALFVDTKGVWSLGEGRIIDSATPTVLRAKNFIRNVGSSEGLSRYEITDAGRKALEASK